MRYKLCKVDAFLVLSFNLLQYISKFSLGEKTSRGLEKVPDLLLLNVAIPVRIEGLEVLGILLKLLLRGRHVGDVGLNYSHEVVPSLQKKTST